MCGGCSRYRYMGEAFLSKFYVQEEGLAGLMTKKTATA
jgi:hypothetical protein